MAHLCNVQDSTEVRFNFQFADGHLAFFQCLAQFALQTEAEIAQIYGHKLIKEQVFIAVSIPRYFLFFAGELSAIRQMIFEASTDAHRTTTSLMKPFWLRAQFFGPERNFLALFLHRSENK